MPTSDPTALASWGATPPKWLARSIIGTIETMCATAAAAAQISPESLFLRDRGPAHVAVTRQLVMCAIRQRLSLPFETIGQIFARRDHGTVIHACKATAARCAKSPSIQSLFDSLNQ